MEEEGKEELVERSLEREMEGIEENAEKQSAADVSAIAVRERGESSLEREYEGKGNPRNGQ